MSYTPEHKQRSRARILGAAGRLFAERGFENVTIDEVMAAAGMTRGAFYSHFANKAALYAESITSAAVNNPRAREALEAEPSVEQLRQLASAYLSHDHVEGRSEPCPLGFLVTDIVNREPEGRRAYTHVFQRFAELIAVQLSGKGKAKRQRAYAISALMIGGVALSRAVVEDREMVGVLLRSCLGAVEQLIENDA
jgi:TetR/AcrR family transcriptional repressor of nem operon